MRNSFEVTFEVCCAECGEGLEATETNNNISVELCQKCLEKAIKESKKN